MKYFIGLGTIVGGIIGYGIGTGNLAQTFSTKAGNIVICAFAICAGLVIALWLVGKMLEE